MRARFILNPVLMCLLSPLLLGASGDTPRPAATFQKRTELVQVDVIVTGRRGEHVRGLKKQDFTVLEDGQPRDIAVFEEVETGKRPAQRAVPPAGEYSNEIAAGQRPNRLTIIVLDALNTDFADFAWARGKLWKYLTSVAQSGEPVAISVMDRRGIHLIHDFTTDPRILAAALKTVRPGAAQDQTTQSANGGGTAVSDAAPVQVMTPTSGSAAALQQEVARLTSLRDQMFNDFAGWQVCERFLTTHASLQALAHAYAGVPGRKALVWVSNARLSVPRELPTKGPHASAGLCGAADMPEKTWEALSDAGVVVYPTSAEGLPLDSILPYWEYSWGPMSDLARATGGKAFYGRNDLEVGFQEAAQDSTQYYSLGYYLKQSTPGWRKLTVKLRNPNLRVRARAGFYVAPPVDNPEKALENDFALAAGSPLDFTGLPFRLRITDAQPLPSGKRLVHLLATVPGNAITVDDTDGNHVLLDFGIIANTAQGERPVHFGRRLESRMSAQALAKARTGGVTYETEVELDPGDYTLRLIVRDALSGKMGSVSAPYKLE